MNCNLEIHTVLRVLNIKFGILIWQAEKKGRQRRRDNSVPVPNIQAPSPAPWTKKCEFQLTIQAADE